MLYLLLFIDCTSVSNDWKSKLPDPGIKMTSVLSPNSQTLLSTRPFYQYLFDFDPSIFDAFIRFRMF